MLRVRPGHPDGVKTGTIVGGRYRMRGLIGRGAMAAVYLASDMRLDRTVAVKIALAGDPMPDLEERTQQEVRALAGLDHPHVVRLLDAGRWQGRDFLVLEHVDGPSLALRLRAGPVPEDDAARIVGEAASALAYLHERGIVHRDVKPANILLDRAGHAHVADFGAARLLDASTRLTATGQLIGTACYLSPEQVRGGPIGPATDVYALGLVLLEAVTGRREYDGAPVEAAVARLNRPPVLGPQLPAPWVQRIEAMTALDPARRVSAATVAEWFVAPSPTLVIGEPSAAGRRASPITGRPRLSRRMVARGGVGLGAAAAAVTVAAVLSAASSGNSGPDRPGFAATSASATAPSVAVPAAVVASKAAPTTKSAAAKPASKPVQKPAPKHDSDHHDDHHHGRG